MTLDLPIQPTGDAPTRTRENLVSLLARHEAWRADTLNLIASENVLSPAVHAVLGSDLVHRYADYTGRDLSARRYRGTRFVVEIEQEVERLAQSVFNVRHVELRALSGHLAGAAVRADGRHAAAARTEDAVLRHELLTGPCAADLSAAPVARQLLEGAG